MMWMAFKMLGSLALLMFGMMSMSEALQKMAGPQLRRVLGTMTTNLFATRTLKMRFSPMETSP